MEEGFKSYLITDPSFYSSFEEFKNYLTTIYQKYNIDFATYRDKENFSIKYAKEFLRLSKSFGIETVMINSYHDKAKELGFDGVHLTSKQFDRIKEAKENGLFVVISTHDFDEIDISKKQGADAITFSPVFYTPNKSKPKGIEVLKNAVEFAKPVKCFALGGIITQEQIQKCKDTGGYGFASIRYFVS